MKATIGAIVTIVTGAAPQIAATLSTHVARTLPLAVISQRMEDMESYCRIGSYVVSMGVGLATMVFMIRRKRPIDVPEQAEVDEPRRKVG